MGSSPRIQHFNIQKHLQTDKFPNCLDRGNTYNQIYDFSLVSRGLLHPLTSAKQSETYEYIQSIISAKKRYVAIQG